MPDLSSTAFGKPTNKLSVFTALAEHANDETAHKCITLFNDTDQFIRKVRVPKVSDLSFILDGIPFQARNTPKGAMADLVIWGTLGYLPYSVTSKEKRESLITILESSRRLSTAFFGVDSGMKIVVTGQFEIPNPPTPNYIFEPLIKLYQEARPYIKLIADYL